MFFGGLLSRYRTLFLNIVLLGVGVVAVCVVMGLQTKAAKTNWSYYQKLIQVQSEPLNDAKTVTQISNVVLDLKQRQVFVESPIALPSTSLFMTGVLPIRSIGGQPTDKFFLIYGVFNADTGLFHSSLSASSSFEGPEAASNLLHHAYQDVVIAKSDIFMGNNSDQVFNDAWSQAIGLNSEVYRIADKTYILPIGIQILGPDSQPP